MKSIEINRPGSKKEKVHLRAQKVSIGRSKNNDIRLNFKEVSECHAIISLRGEKYFILDLESTNGTYVNGVAFTQCVLADNDIIKIGETNITYKEDK